MKIYHQAKNVLEKNQSAVVVFTRGKFLTYDSLGNGLSGKWVAKPESLEKVDKVIIYLRRKGDLVNRIYLGKYEGNQPSDLPHRLMIRFSDLNEVGRTNSNWLEFAGSGQNPVSYVSG